MFGISKRALTVVGVLILVIIVYVVQNDHKGNATTTSGGIGCQMQVTADVLNVRQTPSDTGKIVGTLVSGKVTGATATVQNAYRELGDGRWVSNQFVKQVSGSC